MIVEVIGIDHAYVSVRDLGRSERFYDRIMDVLGFRKRRSDIGGDPHLHYDNRQFGYSLKPEREGASDDDSCTRGLHRFCFRVAGEGAMDRAARALWEAGAEATEPCY